jgi:hypothetical protein
MADPAARTGLPIQRDDDVPDLTPRPREPR